MKRLLLADLVYDLATGDGKDNHGNEQGSHDIAEGNLSHTKVLYDVEGEYGLKYAYHEAYHGIHHEKDEGRPRDEPPDIDALPNRPR